MLKASYIITLLSGIGIFNSCTGNFINLPEYRRQGIAAALTSQLAVECLAREIVPFYSSAWSNLKSVRNALRSGFQPGWIQLTVKSNDSISAMNRI